MKKDIKDYLHLYLGCEILTGTGNVTLIAVQKEVIPCTNFRIIVLNGNVVHEVSGRDFKPLLRPLSDMTEDEDDKIDSLMPSPSYRDNINENYWNVKQFLYLLSKGFDLFNLIPEGLAIDKTKLKTS